MSLAFSEHQVVEGSAGSLESSPEADDSAPAPLWQQRVGLRMRTSHSFILLCCLSLVLLPNAWPQQDATAKQHPKIDGEPLFGQNCAACHGSDGRGGERAPNIATTHDVVALSDAELHDIVSKGRLSTGMPGFGALGDDKVDALAAYVRTLQGMTAEGAAALPGDPRRGEAIFFGQAACSGCHMMNGRGGFMGEDLSDYARGHTVGAVRSAIVHPDATGSAGTLVTVETVKGTTLKGLIRSQDNFTVVLQSEDGVFHSLARDSIRQPTASTVPYMPQDYASRFDKKQIDDLVSYLLKSAAIAKSSSLHQDNDD